MTIVNARCTIASGRARADRRRHGRKAGAIVAKIDITKTELVWPGKYDDDGTRRETPRVNLPF